MPISPISGALSRQPSTGASNQILSELQRTINSCDARPELPELQFMSNSGLQKLLMQTIQQKRQHMIRAMQLASQGATEVAKILCDVTISDKCAVDLRITQCMEVPLLNSIKAQRDAYSAQQLIDAVHFVQHKRRVLNDEKTTLAEQEFTLAEQEFKLNEREIKLVEQELTLVERERKLARE